MTEQQNHFDQWVILELMGHRKQAGRLTERTIGGKGFLQIDIPGREKIDKMRTQLYSPDAVYCITPVTEAVARAAAPRFTEAPVQPWELAKMLPGQSRGHGEDQDDYWAPRREFDDMDDDEIDLSGGPDQL
ncbi:hypothetical protein LCGC14_2264800 [marine sediment metagenome]|uniref:Uncharacterized protein n=1 Tax=marine sediment metagenome TaxID=412755 RepID=A0A0F9CYX1_9ZZZZ